jgi:general secretion pathway protein H
LTEAVELAGARPGQRAPGAGGAAGGFTLLELIAVLALLGLMLALVLPGLQRTLQRQRARAGLRQLATTLRLARSEAATTHRRERVFLNMKTRRYQLEASGRQGEFPALKPAEARLVWQSPERQQGYIAFYGDGSSSGGRLVLVEDGGRRHLLEVAVITGKVSLTTEGP